MATASKESVRVSAIPLSSQPCRIEENLATIESWCWSAHREKADLVLFPELSLTGFIPNHPVGDHAQWLTEVLQAAWASAQTLSGAVVGRLEKLSLQTGLFIAAGMLENAGNVLFNTHVLVGEGKLYGYWRKMHIPLFEMQVYNGGGVPEVVDTPLGRIGANICFDTLLPESTRLLGVQNAEIVLFPFAADPPPATPQGWSDWAGPALKARCAENGVFGVSCNYLGKVDFAGATQTFPGGAMIVGPNGAVLAQLTEQSNGANALSFDLDRKALVEARSRFEYTMRFRRPELYGSLARGV
jgi:N-carbamoylputrescine amidase